MDALYQYQVKEEYSPLPFHLDSAVISRGSKSAVDEFGSDGTFCTSMKAAIPYNNASFYSLLTYDASPIQHSQPKNSHGG